MSWPGSSDMKAAITSLLSRSQPSASRINAVKAIAVKHHKVCRSYLIRSEKGLSSKLESPIPATVKSLGISDSSDS